MEGRIDLNPEYQRGERRSISAQISASFAFSKVINVLSHLSFPSSIHCFGQTFVSIVVIPSETFFDFPFLALLELDFLWSLVICFHLSFLRYQDHHVDPLIQTLSGQTRNK